MSESKILFLIAVSLGTLLTRFLPLVIPSTFSNKITAYKLIRYFPPFIFLLLMCGALFNVSGAILLFKIFCLLIVLAVYLSSQKAVQSILLGSIIYISGVNVWI